MRSPGWRCRSTPQAAQDTANQAWAVSAAPGLLNVGTGRATGLAEHTALVEGALAEAGIERRAIVADERIAAVLLDTAARAPEGDACAGARVEVDDGRGTVERVIVRVSAGDPLDEVVLRS